MADFKARGDYGDIMKARGAALSASRAFRKGKAHLAGYGGYSVS